MDIDTGIRIRAVSLHDAVKRGALYTQSNIWHIPVDEPLIYRGICLPGTKESLLRFRFDCTTFAITDTRNGIAGTCKVLICSRVEGPAPYGIKRFIQRQRYSEEFVADILHWPTQWEFYLNTPGDTTHLREKLGREPTSDDLERLIIEETTRAWSRR